MGNRPTFCDFLGITRCGVCTLPTEPALSAWAKLGRSWGAPPEPVCRCEVSAA